MPLFRDYHVKMKRAVSVQRQRTTKEKKPQRFCLKSEKSKGYLNLDLHLLKYSQGNILSEQNKIKIRGNTMKNYVEEIQGQQFLLKKIP